MFTHTHTHTNMLSVIQGEREKCLTYGDLNTHLPAKIMLNYMHFEMYEKY